MTWLISGFSQRGARAGNSVAKLLVPRYEGGAPALENNKARRRFGTGWLITDRLVVTNHHIVNCRNQQEPPASDADLLLQGSHTITGSTTTRPTIRVSMSKSKSWRRGIRGLTLRFFV